MKKIIITIAMVLIGLASYSQNFVGESFRDVKKSMNDKGFIISEKYVDGVYRLQASDNNEIRFYYFSDDNTCYAYRLFLFDQTYSEIEKSLLSIGYRKISSRIFNNEKYKAEIEYLESEKQWYVTITKK
jgi:hypothetical protein